MKLFRNLAIALSLATAATAAAGCLADPEDDVESEPELGTDESEIEAVPICQSTTVENVEFRPCGIGPNGPIRKRCEQTCTTHRHMVWNAFPEPYCETDLTGCTFWQCEECPD